jgi:hypothetical protein
MIGAEIHDDTYRLSKGQTGKWTPLGYFGGRGDAPGKIMIVDSPARAVRIRLDAANLKDTVSFDMR